MRILKTVFVTAQAAMLAVLILASAARAQPGTTGIGAHIGDPTGLSFKFYGAPGSYDLLLSWDLDRRFFAHFHALLLDRPLGTAPLRYYIGPGLFVNLRSRRDRDADVDFGISGNFGLSFFIDRFEIFGQITPRMAVVPATTGTVGYGIGARFYF